jgi:hypothetical protein
LERAGVILSDEHLVLTMLTGRLIPMYYGWTHAHIDAEIPKRNCGRARKNKINRGEAKFPLVSTRAKPE